MDSMNKIAPLTFAPGWAEYLRVTGSEAMALRSQAQQHRLSLERVIEPSGLPLVATYVDGIDGASGRTHTRDNYQRLLADAQHGTFSHVVIAQLHCFSRNSLEALRAFDELLALGLTLRIATYPSLEPETADGRLMLGALYATAEFEASLHSQRAATGRRLARQWRNESNPRH
ncbi:MAG: recombinase family protein [Aggregatilineales bacterium]